MADNPLGSIQLLRAIQTNNYFIAAAGALVVYDHVLTLSQEVDYIWNRQWSFMMALYLMARYSGTLSMIVATALSIYLNWTYSGFVNMDLAKTWTENTFALTMQAILAIRVYALFNQSKKVLVCLAISYVLQASAVIVTTALPFNNQTVDQFVIAVGPATGSVTQGTEIDPTAVFLLAQESTFVSVVFDIILLLFALWAFVRHALEAKTRDGGWFINVLVRTLVADHLMYFVCNLTWLVLILASDYTNNPEGSLMSQDVYFVFNALAVISGPGMVISLRAKEDKTRGEGETLGGEASTIQFGVPQLPTQLESVMEEGSGFRAMDENVQTD
ncbi:hypothetical protein BJ138DRAFT_1165388 [Hygrophoropsis aurantiaca]|uniref:Uncharacterized protein n=1 Tax=Hygrophoropsis aurantiaca TaxID=72124 RepID=A0ACB7ZWR5_9AGAM|nr:hypothetical protein BJ138DRAFT_1165388 [Hygrophoropsis aurantiaca]